MEADSRAAVPSLRWLCLSFFRKCVPGPLEEAGAMLTRCLVPLLAARYLQSRVRLPGYTTSILALVPDDDMDDMLSDLSLATLPPAKLRLLWDSSVTRACADGASPSLIQDLGRGRLHNLSHLSLRRSRLDERALRSLAALASLESIDLGESPLAASPAALGDLLTALPRLHTLSLAACGLRAGDALHPLLRGISAASALRDLDLSENDVDDEAVSLLGDFLARATRLRLMHTHVTDEGAMAIAQACPALTALDLSRTAVSDVGARAVLAQCRALQSVALAATRCTAEIIDAIRVEASPTLLSLDLSHLHLLPCAAARAAGVGQAVAARLRALALCGERILLGTALHEFSSLAVLRLTGAAADAVSLHRGLIGLRALEEVDLTNAGDGLFRATSLLPSAHSLRRLSLHGAAVEWPALALALPRLRCLRSLDLRAGAAPEGRAAPQQALAGAGTARASALHWLVPCALSALLHAQRVLEEHGGGGGEGGSRAAADAAVLVRELVAAVGQEEEEDVSCSPAYIVGTVPLVAASEPRLRRALVAFAAGDGPDTAQRLEGALRSAEGAAEAASLAWVAPWVTWLRDEALHSLSHVGVYASDSDSDSDSSSSDSDVEAYGDDEHARHTGPENGAWCGLLAAPALCSLRLQGVAPVPALGRAATAAFTAAVAAQRARGVVVAVGGPLEGVVGSGEGPDPTEWGAELRGAVLPRGVARA